MGSRFEEFMLGDYLQAHEPLPPTLNGVGDFNIPNQNYVTYTFFPAPGIAAEILSLWERLERRARSDSNSLQST